MGRGQSPYQTDTKDNRISSGTEKSWSWKIGIVSVRPFHALRQSALVAVRRRTFLWSGKRQPAMSLPKRNSEDGHCYWMMPEVREELQPLFDQCIQDAIDGKITAPIPSISR